MKTPGMPIWEENHWAVRGDEFALCLDAATGKRLWATRLTDYGLAYNNHRCFDSASPLVAGGRVYLHSPTGHLYCLAAKGGNLLWEVNLFEHKMYRWTEKHGNHGSPLLVGDAVIVNYMGALQDDYRKAAMVDHNVTTCQVVGAFDAANGKEKWVAKAPLEGFRINNSSAANAVINQQPTLLVSCGIGTAGIDPANGSVLWSYRMTPANSPFPYCGLAPATWKNYVIDTTSVAHDNCPSETRCLKIEGNKATLVWTTHEFVPMSEINKSNLLIADGKLYGADAAGGWGGGDPNKKDGDWAYRKFRGPDVGQFQCWDIATGKRLWHSKAFCPENVDPYKWPGEFRSAATLLAGDKLIVLNPWGLWIARLKNDGVTVLVHDPRFNGDQSESPVLVDGLLYVRQPDCGRGSGNLACFDLRLNAK